MSISVHSVQTRLIGAFGAVVALSLAGVTASVIAFSGAKGSLDEVAERTAPKAAAAQQLEAATGAITGELAAFSRSRDTIDMQVSASRLSALADEAAAAIAALRASGAEPSEVASLQDGLDGVRDAVASATGPVEAVLQARNAREAGMRAALADRAEAAEALETVLDDTSDPADVETLLRANMALNLAVARYAELAASSSLNEVSDVRDEFDYAADELRINLTLLADLATPAILEPSERLLARADGADGLFALRETELRLVAEVESVVEDARIIDAALVADVESARDAALADQQAASRSGQAAIGFGQTLVTLFGVAALVLSALILWLYVSRSLLARLKAMRDGMTKLAAGEIGEEMAADGRDELADMARAVNVFRANAIERRRLEAERGEDQAARERRVRAMEELIARFEQVSARALGKVGEAAAEMQDAAHALDSASRGASETTAVVNASSGRAAENVDTVAAAAEQMTGSIAEIAQQIGRSSEIAQEAATRVKETSGDVEALNVAARQIGDIVKLINDIAEQTNLLALNATIEAARAGEAGKGFAVVASEVKTLAEQTGQATSSISRQISDIQSATGKAVQAIASIGGVIGEMNAISAAIAAAMEEQRAAASEITRAAHDAASGAREVARSIAKVDAAASETGQCAAQVNAASEALNGEADGLERAVKEFLSGVRAA